MFYYGSIVFPNTKKICKELVKRYDYNNNQIPPIYGIITHINLFGFYEVLWLDSYTKEVIKLPNGVFNDEDLTECYTEFMYTFFSYRENLLEEITYEEQEGVKI